MRVGGVFWQLQMADKLNFNLRTLHSMTLISHPHDLYDVPDLLKISMAGFLNKLAFY